jgi:hypothetical protein
MKPAFRILALAALLLLPAACAEQNGTAPEPAAAPVESVPVAFRLGITGKNAPVLAEDGSGQVTLRHKETKALVPVAFGNGALAVHDLAPGEYSITGIGPLICRGLDFELGEARGRALGEIRAEIVETDYYVALMASRPASRADVTELAAQAQIAPGSVDARPLPITESAPCYLSKSGPGTTWQERPLGEKILLGIGIAAFCAAALASGGFCVF